MKSEVTFIQDHLIKNMQAELKKQLPKHFSKGDKVCIKAHMGEYGNLNYLRPSIVGAVVEVLKSIGAKPFVFDSPVAYKGSRDTSEKYYECARRNGFTEETMGCPIVISNKGKAVKSKFFDIEVCKDLIDADGLFVLSHFKGHELANWGGAIKNLGMGAVTKESKSAIHSGLNPFVAHPEKCTSCETCVDICGDKLISMKNGKPFFKNCFGCGACILACPENVLEGGLALGAGLAEATRHVLVQFDKKKLFFVNVMLDISDKCDCTPIGNVEPEIQEACPNIGLVISSDPVAIDKASLDLADKATNGKFGKLWPADKNLQIEYGVKFGLGSKEYVLKNVKTH